MHTFEPGDAFYYFTVQRVLGAGYHGAVYEIRHRETGDLFALKTMHAADCVDPTKTARALAGAKGNYRIDHRNVVKVLDLNCEANGLVWMRTELLRGYTIQELLARQGRVSLPFALATATEAAFGLHAVHEAQIIHRDVKPSNLFYTESRAVKVIDLSLAKVFPEGIETTVGRLGLGTPAYSAPEQLEGQVRPDVRFDVYALGITLWEMLAGRHPFQEVLHDVHALVKRQLTTMPPLLSEVARLPARIDEVVHRAIAKDPAQRYGSMMEMARALMEASAWVDGEARARRIIVVVPHGEPQRPGDANAWREYRGPEPAPSHDVPEPLPPARVIVAERAPRPAPLAATEPLVPAAPRSLAATTPLDETPAPGAPGRAEVRRTAGELLHTDATARRGATPWRSIPAPAPSGRPRETPDGVAHTRPGAPPAHPARRTPWAAVIAAGLIASIGSVTLVVSVHGRGVDRVRAMPAVPSGAATSPANSPSPPAPNPSATADQGSGTAVSDASEPAATHASPTASAPPPAPSSKHRRVTASPNPTRSPEAPLSARPSPPPPPAPKHGPIFGVEN